MNALLKCGHSLESCRAVPCCGAVCLSTFPQIVILDSALSEENGFKRENSYMLRMAATNIRRQSDNKRTRGEVQEKITDAHITTTRKNFALLLCQHWLLNAFNRSNQVWNEPVGKVDKLYCRQRVA